MEKQKIKKDEALKKLQDQFADETVKVCTIFVVSQSFLFYLKVFPYFSFSFEKKSSRMVDGSSAVISLLA